MISSKDRLRREIELINKHPVDYVSAGPKNDNIFEWVATIMGPKNTPYQGGVFVLDIKFPFDYPFMPPKILFKTQIYTCKYFKRG